MARNNIKEQEKLEEDSQIYNNGYNKAIVDIMEYLFNTANHQDKEKEFYISHSYLKQTLKFLAEKRDE